MCCVWSPLPTCHRHYPGRSDGACSLVSLHRGRPSLCNSQVGSCNYCFGTCSALTHVMACTLAESPSDPFHRKLRQFLCLHCRFDCFRVERTSSRAGVELFSVLTARKLLILRMARGAKKAPLPLSFYVYCTKLLSLFRKHPRSVAVGSKPQFLPITKQRYLLTAALFSPG
jgi:hypothetical protein